MLFISNSAEMSVYDNGTALPCDVRFDGSSGFGLNPVTILIEQIGGKSRIVQDNGTAFVFRFNVM